MTAQGLAVGLASRHRAVFMTGLTRPLPWRRAQLESLIATLRRDAGVLTEAMAADLGKPEFEAWVTDVAAVRKDIEGIARNLGRWAAPRPVRVPWTLQPARAEIRPEPLGRALVIGPWNYPVRCTVLPLAFALAAGNTVALKPSELAPTTSAALARLLGDSLDGDAVSVVQGGPVVAQELLGQPWDHIFFTGGAKVGRLVMAAAAHHLTPVTLELGGKNPAVVTSSADIKAAARRIAWGKFLNAGQSCVAPDFVLVDRTVESALLDALRHTVQEFYGEDPSASTALGRVVNAAHFDRLAHLLATTEGKTVCGGQADRAQRYLAPTVLAGVTWDDPVMEGEIFGPVLPVVSYGSLDEALGRLNRRDKPLALYVFTKDQATADQVVAGTSSGSVCVNHNAVQLAVPGLPFGGVGASGMGAYHGRAGFDTFSHLKAVLRKPARGEIPLVYPPYSALKRWALHRVLG
jgi:aldehyde dehydrogenase (NAD+)